MAAHEIPDDLTRLARRIIDGEDIDWSAPDLEASVPPERLRHLRSIDRIRREHRRLLDEDLPFRAWGPLDLRGHLADGGFGEVYLAHDRNLDREVALKLFREDDDRVACRRFVEEARRLARVDHPNVVTVHGVDRHEGRLGLWMEHVRGETLEERLDEHGPLGAHECIAIGVELCRALAAVHAAGLVHRDVKAANVVRERGGRLVLMDFGSASRGTVPPQAPLSGTPAYVPPEVLAGGDSAERVDVYALGVLLHRLASGEYPAGRPLLELRPTLPAEFVRVVERALDPDPRRRFAGAGEMERALSAALAGERVADAAPGVGDPAAARRRRRIAGAAVAVAAVATFAALPFLVPGRGALDAEAEFFRLTASGAEERLRAGLATRPGDRLFLELEAAESAWVYVINADARGEQNLLFPVAGLDRTNPLPAGAVRLPGTLDGVERTWEVTSRGGRETLLVVASRAPIGFLEERLAAAGRGARGVPVRLAEAGADAGAEDDAVRRLRGIAGLTDAAPADSGGAPALDDLRRAIRTRAAAAKGLRVWEWTLENPP